MTNVVFIDTETTGLEPDRHEVWEIGLIRGDTGEEIQWAIRPDLSKADPGALRINRFYERVPASWSSPHYVAERLAILTAGKHLVGAVPSFDAAFLERFLRRYGQAPAWHYHLVDVEALAVGRLTAMVTHEAGIPLRPPWDSRALSRALGIPEQPAADKHTALGDARWAKAIYDKVMGE